MKVRRFLIFVLALVGILATFTTYVANAANRQDDAGSDDPWNASDKVRALVKGYRPLVQNPTLEKFFNK
ncbi:MAG: hypothetical protein N3B12_02220 [Armatimonadetes bacterium]|nr:hypothetical protein [Armatimonadota bacterium]